MRRRTLIVHLVLFAGIVVLYANKAIAQDSANAAGSNATGPGGSVSYSVGQIVYTSQNGNAGNLTQGVQHAYEVYYTSMQEAGKFELRLFPNPTAEQLTLIMSEYTDEGWFCELYDINGKLLLKKNIMSNETQIDMIQFPPAIYSLRITSLSKKNAESYKIIKK